MSLDRKIAYADYIGEQTFFNEELLVVDYDRVSTKKEAQYFSLDDQVEANKNFIIGKKKIKSS